MIILLDAVAVGGYSRRVNDDELKQTLGAEALMNDTARYLHDKHRALQSRLG
jgi:hypothetical protein